MTSPATPRIAVLIPCLDEAASIAKTVADFRAVLPGASIHVFDNGSTDGSPELAAAAGAVVSRVPLRGKGNVVRQMFQTIDADVFLMVDADDTYPAEAAPALLAPVLAGEADMVVGDRLSTTYRSENKRPGHNFGNALVCSLVRLFWHCRLRDVMSGYRAFSRRFVKNCPVLSPGFEIETELTLHALDKRLAIREIPIVYRDRTPGNPSKLRTVRDGFRVLATIANAFRLYRPLAFFGLVGLFSMLLAAGLFLPVLFEFWRTGLVPRFPTLIVSVFLALTGLLSCSLALVLDAVKKQEARAFEYRLLSPGAPPPPPR